MWASTLTEDNEYLRFRHGCALFHGRVQDNSLHRHHALQIVVAADRAFGLHDVRQWHPTRAAVLAPDPPGRLEGVNGRQLRRVDRIRRGATD